ncbi:MAG: transcriptional regulator [Lachnospiraceae bacterium]|nr:transcriptional regulator [Lachnospiraceae bacterium]
MEKSLNSASIGIDRLMKEIQEGEYQKDILPNSALGFTREQQAQYFSNLRKNLQSEMADIVINDLQSLKEIELLKKWGIWNHG